MFDDIEFKSAVANSRGARSSSPVVVTQHIGANKEEQTYKISREAMDKCNLIYKDKVDVLFSSDFTVCRIQKAASGLTLSQQTSTNEQSAAVMRMQFRKDIHPNLIEIAQSQDKGTEKKAIFENGEIDYKDGCLTFELKVV